MPISRISNIVKRIPTANISQYRLERGTKRTNAMKTYASIPEEAKAGGTFVKKVIVEITPEGPKVNLIQ